MLKYVFLASAMTLSVPAMAQDKPASNPSASTREALPASTAAKPTDTTQPAPDTATPDAMTTDQTATPAQDSTVAEQKPADPATPVASAAPVNAAPVNKADQVAQVVNSEFPSYDKDSNGSLSATEFGSWMVALKTASDPATKADSAETKTWISGAFTSADKDKNSAVTKAELTGFLSQG